MTPAEAYMDFIAIVRHFTSDYDYFRYGGKLRLKRETFDKRPDRWMFEKLARRHDARWVIISSVLVGKKWIGDMITDEAVERALETQKRVQSLAYTMRSEFDYLMPMFDDNLVCPPNTHPHLVKQYMAGRVSLETLAAIVDVTGCHQHWLDQGDRTLTTLVRFVMKYIPFIQIDRERIRRLLVDSFAKAA